MTGLRVEAVLAVLAAMGSAPAPAASPGLYAAGTLARDATHRAHPGALAWLPFAVAAAGIAWYTCLALEPGARSARAEPLTALTLQWLTVAVTQRIATTPAVIIAGADEITRTHLEALADACERRGVPLNLLFRHLLGCCCGAGLHGIVTLHNEPWPPLDELLVHLIALHTGQAPDMIAEALRVTATDD